MARNQDFRRYDKTGGRNTRDVGTQTNFSNTGTVEARPITPGSRQRRGSPTPIWKTLEIRPVDPQYLARSRRGPTVPIPPPPQWKTSRRRGPTPVPKWAKTMNEIVSRYPSRQWVPPERRILKSSHSREIDEEIDEEFDSFARSRASYRPRPLQNSRANRLRLDRHPSSIDLNSDRSTSFSSRPPSGSSSHGSRLRFDAHSSDTSSSGSSHPPSRGSSHDRRCGPQCISDLMTHLNERDKSICENIISNEGLFASKSNKEIIEYILTEVKTLQEFQNEFSQIVNEFWKNHRKSAEKYRNSTEKGIQFFAEGNNEKAFDCFTEAILNAPTPQLPNHCNELSIAYENRSKAYLNICDSENCLFDANQSLQLMKSEKVYLIKHICLQRLKRYREAIEVIDDMIGMSERNELALNILTINELQAIRKISEIDLKTFGDVEELHVQQKRDYNFWIHPKCEIVDSGIRGRIMRTKAFIKKGTKVLIEKPYCVTFHKQYSLSHCNNCQKYIKCRIYPCFGCNEVVFCDENCFDEAFNAFHRWECRSTTLLESLGDNQGLAFRIFCKLGPNNVYNLDKFEKQIESENRYDFSKYLLDKRQKTIPFKDKTDVEKENEFQLLVSFEHHNKDHTITKNILNCYYAIRPTILLSYCGILKSDVLENLEDFIKFTDHMVTYIRRSSCNCFGYFDEWTAPLPNIDPKASMFCLVCTFVNHSCDPNTDFEIIDRKQTFTTNRGVEAGHEICITYGPIQLDPFGERQQQLKSNYFFECLCSVCQIDVKKFDEYLRLFNDHMNDPNFEVLSEESLLLADNYLKEILDLNPNMKSELSETINLVITSLIELGKYKDAFEYYYSYFEESMEDKPSTDDLIFWTNIYYTVLKDANVEKKDHNQYFDICFGLYFKLFQVFQNEPNISESLKNEKTLEFNELKLIEKNRY